MKILLVDSITRGHCGFYLKRAFEQLGHEVASFDPYRRDILYHLKRPLRLLDRSFPTNSARSRHYLMKHNNPRLIALAKAEKPELIFFINGKLADRELLAALKAVPAKLACWFIDDTFDFTTSIQNAARYDRYFTNAKYLVDEYRTRGASRTEFLPFGCDPEFHKGIDCTGADRAAYACEVSFVGQMSPAREALLGELAEFDVKFFGPGWHRKLAPGSPVLEKWQHRSVHGDELVKAYRLANVSVNIHLDRERADTGLNMRTFEIPACGGVQLVDRKREIGEIFEEGETVMSFGTDEEFKEKLTHLIKDGSANERLRERSAAFVRKHHTYRHRAEEIMSFIS